MRPIRRRVHVATLLAVCWTPFIALLIFMLVDSWRHANRANSGFNLYFGLSLMLMVFLLQALFIVFSIHYWKTEKPRLTPGTSGFMVDDWLDMNPENIDLVAERSRLKRILIGDTGSFGFVMFAAWQSYISGGIRSSGLRATAILFGGIFFLHMVAEAVRYLILKSRTYKHSNNINN